MSILNFLNSLYNFFLPYLNLIKEGSSGGSASTGVTELPLSVITEIILKLPIKSIIRSRCVCKSWYNITLDPYFTSSYFANPPFTAVALSQHRIVGNCLGDKSFDFLELGRNGDVMRTPFNPKALNFHRSGFLSIMGSCNGLLCLVQAPTCEHGSYGNQDSTCNKQTVYIINPLLGEFTMLPRAKPAKNTCSVVYCLGCNRYSDSYKALRISASYVDGGHGYQVGFEILTIGVDVKWRSLDPAFAAALFPCGICLNGAIHLVGGESPFGFILAFDIEEEKGHCFSLPSGLGDKPRNIVLAVWDDKLCFVDNNVEGRVEIWTMKQYGDVESWSRDIILKSWIPFDLRHYRLIPIATLRNGDLLMARENEGDIRKHRPNHLVSFNPKKETCTKHEISGDDEVVVSFFHGYIPRFFT